ncbi:CBU_0585 family protein [Candidatus Comchoanobacter bicostacola]|uniref:CBU_0585 family protein n=1 Tax=Candidatus Comchoanobacter bicostacola TaxID=2919598 RepID=UPI003CCC9C11
MLHSLKRQLIRYFICKADVLLDQMRRSKKRSESEKAEMNKYKAIYQLRDEC